MKLCSGCILLSHKDHKFNEFEEAKVEIKENLEETIIKNIDKLHKSIDSNQIQ